MKKFENLIFFCSIIFSKTFFYVVSNYVQWQKNRSQQTRLTPPPTCAYYPLSGNILFIASSLGSSLVQHRLSRIQWIDRQILWQFAHTQTIYRLEQWILSRAFPSLAHHPTGPHTLNHAHRVFKGLQVGMDLLFQIFIANRLSIPSSYTLLFFKLTSVSLY